MRLGIGAYLYGKQVPTPLHTLETHHRLRHIQGKEHGINPQVVGSEANL